MERINVSNNIDMTVTVVIFKEGNVYIAYCPSLDISGYDTTAESAKKSFEIVIRNYLDYCLENNTLDKDLRNHGWTKKGEMTFGELVAQNDTLRNIIDKNDFSKYSFPIMFNEHVQAQ